MLVSQSAIGYYGDRGDSARRRVDGPGEGFDSEVVQEWEKAAHEVEGSGVRLVIVRTGHVLDPRGGLLKRLLPPFKLGVGGPLAGGDQYMSWIHIDDEVGILLWALDSERSAARSTPPPEPGHQPRVVAGARPGAAAARRRAGPGVRARPDVRPRVRRDRPRAASG